MSAQTIGRPNIGRPNVGPAPVTKAAITGATGMVGGYLVNHLLNLGLPVRAPVRQTSDTRALQQAGVEVVAGDMRDRAFLQEAVAGCEIVFHLAGFAKASAAFAVPGRRAADEEDSRRYWDANVKLTKDILAASLAGGVKRFVFASSTSVYSPEAVSPIAEDAPTEPVTTYGRSKVAAEERVRAYHEKGLQGVIIRPGVIYGTGDRHFLPTIQAISKLPLLPLVHGGRHRHDLVHAADVAEAMWLAGQADLDGVGVFNTGSGRPQSVREFVTIVARVFGRSPRIVAVSPFVARSLVGIMGLYLRYSAPSLSDLFTPLSVAYLATDFIYDISRAEKVLGFRPRRSFEEGIRAALAGEL